MSNGILSELGVALILMALAVTFIPILIGVGIAFLIGATGIFYFTVVTFISIILWSVLCWVWWV